MVYCGMGILPMRHRTILVLYIGLIGKMDASYTGKLVLSQTTGIPVPLLTHALIHIPSTTDNGLYALNSAPWNFFKAE